MHAQEVLNLLFEGIAHLLLWFGSTVILLRIKTTGTLLMHIGTWGMAAGFGLRAYAEYLERRAIRYLHQINMLGDTFDVLAVATEGAFTVLFAIGLLHFSTLFREAVSGETRFWRPL